MFGLSRPRIFEIGIAMLLTVAAVIFVGLTVWAAHEFRIRVEEAWATPSGGKSKSTAAAYMSIANEGDGEDVLERVHSPKAEFVEMHQATLSEDGVMRVHQIEGGMKIPAGGSIVFAPGGAQLMLRGLHESLDEGDEVPLTLEFAKAGTVDVKVPVRSNGPISGASAQ